MFFIQFDLRIEKQYATEFNRRNENQSLVFCFSVLSPKMEIKLLKDAQTGQVNA